MDQMTRFYQKNGLVIMRLARDLYSLEVGERLPTIVSYAEEIGTGHGTIQTAIAYLLEQGCMTLEKQGHKGTLITSLDKERLWSFTGWNALLLGCPFPMGNYINSMIGAVDFAFKEAGVPFIMGYSIAAHNRMLGLKNDHYSVIITTKLGMEVSRAEYPDVEIALELPNCIYASPYSLIHTIRDFHGIQDGMRIATNVRSAEQNFLSMELTKRYKLEMVEMTYSESVKALRDGRVDGLLNREDTFTLAYQRREYHFPYYIYSLEDLGYDRAGTIPVLAVKGDNYGLARLLRKVLDPEKIAKMQADILSGKLEPTFF